MTDALDKPVTVTMTANEWARVAAALAFTDDIAPELDCDRIAGIISAEVEKVVDA